MIAQKLRSVFEKPNYHHINIIHTGCMILRKFGLIYFGFFDPKRGSDGQEMQKTNVS